MNKACRSPRTRLFFAKILGSAAASPLNLSASPSVPAPSAADRVLAAELEGRGEAHDALSMMVSTVVRMVQAGKSRESRWQDR